MIRIPLYVRSRYQQIELFADKNAQLAMYLDGALYFHEADEHRYYECLAMPAWCARPAGVLGNVLVLGGGDGLLARELVRLPGTRKVTVVEFDELVARLGREVVELAELNRKSLYDPKVKLLIDDPFGYAQGAPVRQFDGVYVDLPDPVNPASTRFYTKEFYTLLSRMLVGGGVLAVQVPLVPEIFRQARSTLESVFKYVAPYKVWGHMLSWRGFQLCSNVGVTRFWNRVPTWARYLGDATLRTLFHFAKDEKVYLE